MGTKEFLPPDHTKHPDPPPISLPVADSGEEAPKEKDLKDRAKIHTDDALNVLVTIMNDSVAPKQARIQAAQTVLDRGWGKAKQETETTIQITYQDLLNQIAKRERKFIEVTDAEVIEPPAVRLIEAPKPSWNDLI